MTVQDLIDKLNNIDDKSITVIWEMDGNFHMVEEHRFKHLFLYSDDENENIYDNNYLSENSKLSEYLQIAGY